MQEKKIKKQNDGLQGCIRIADGATSTPPPSREGSGHYKTWGVLQHPFALGILRRE